MICAETLIEGECYILYDSRDPAKQFFLKCEQESKDLDDLRAVLDILHRKRSYLWLNYSYSSQAKILCMPYLGAPLSTIHIADIRKDINIFVWVCDELISCIAEFHRAGLCHSCVCPDHILVGSNAHINLVGFDNARFAESPYTLCELARSQTFSSRNCKSRNPRKFMDDWESLLYVLEYALGSSLPWKDSCSSIEEMDAKKNLWITQIFDHSNSKLGKILRKHQKLNKLQTLRRIIQDVQNQQNCAVYVQPMMRSACCSAIECSEMAQRSNRKTPGCYAEPIMLEYARYALMKLGLKLDNVKTNESLCSTKSSSAKAALDFVNAQYAHLLSMPYSLKYDLSSHLHGNSEDLEINARGTCRLIGSSSCNLGFTCLQNNLEKFEIFRFAKKDGINVKWSQFNMQDLPSPRLPGKRGSFFMEFYCNNANLEFNRIFDCKGEVRLVTLPQITADLADWIEMKLILKAIQLEKDIAFQFSKSLNDLSKIVEEVSICAIFVICPCSVLDFSNMFHLFEFVKSLRILGDVLRRGKFYIFHIDSDLSHFLAEHAEQEDLKTISPLLKNVFIAQMARDIEDLKRKTEAQESQIQVQKSQIEDLFRIIEAKTYEIQELRSLISKK
jgi:hypothetical protein